MHVRVPSVVSAGASVLPVGDASVEASILADELLQVSLPDQIFDFPLQVVAVFSLVPYITVVGTVEVRVPLISPPRNFGRVAAEVILPHHSQDVGPTRIEGRQLGVRGGRSAFHDPVEDTSAVSGLV